MQTISRGGAAADAGVPAGWGGGEKGTGNDRAAETRARFRSGRFFAVGHQWYATMRGGPEIGPFTSRDQAELAVACKVASRHEPLATPAGARRACRPTTVLEILIDEIAACRDQLRLSSENRAYAWAKQRLAAIEASPRDFAHADLRVRALRYFLAELDCTAT